MPQQINKNRKLGQSKSHQGKEQIILYDFGYLVYLTLQIKDELVKLPDFVSDRCGFVTRKPIISKTVLNVIIILFRQLHPFPLLLLQRYIDRF